jgi:hypothetical protein
MSLNLSSYSPDWHLVSLKSDYSLYAWGQVYWKVQELSTIPAFVTCIYLSEHEIVDSGFECPVVIMVTEEKPT